MSGIKNRFHDEREKSDRNNVSPAISQRQKEAADGAFMRGQEDWRAGKNSSQNPYPVDAEHLHHAWDEGWAVEEDVQA